MSGFHDLHGASQVAVCGCQYKIIAGKVRHLVLHISRVQIGFPDDSTFYREGTEREFESNVVQFALIDPIGTSCVIARNLFLEQQVGGTLPEPVE